MFAAVHFSMFCLHVMPKHLKMLIRNLSLPDVLYGYETWSLALTEEHRLTRL